MPDEIPRFDDWVKKRSPRDRVFGVARSEGIPDDIAEDFLKVTSVESGHNVNVRNSSKGARGFGQVMPDKKGGNVRTVGNRQYDLRDPDQNITAGLRYFAEGGDDPVARRLYYFGGPKARQRYQQTGRIPNISDGNMTASQYVRATGGQRQPPKFDEWTPESGVPKFDDWAKDSEQIPPPTRRANRVPAPSASPEQSRQQSAPNNYWDRIRARMEQPARVPKKQITPVSGLIDKTVPDLVDVMVQRPLTFEEDRAHRVATQKYTTEAFKRLRQQGVRVGAIRQQVAADLSKLETYSDKHGTRQRMSTPDPIDVDRETLRRSQLELAELERKGRVAKTSNVEYAAQVPKSLASGVTSGVGSTLKGLAVASRALVDQITDTRGFDTQDAYVYRLGEYISEAGRDNALYKANPDLEQEFFIGKAPKVLGQTAVFLLGGWASQSPKLVVSLLGGTMTAGDAYDEVRQSGGTDEDAVYAGLLAGTILGPTELLGLRGAMNALKGTAGEATLKAALKTALREGRKDAIENALQEVGQEYLQGRITGNQRSLDQLVEAGLLGAVGGAGTVPVSLATQGGRRGTQTEVQPTVEAQRPPVEPAAGRTADGSPVEVGVPAVEQVQPPVQGLDQPVPAESRQRFYHKDWGEIEVLQDQSGARPGRVRVAEVADPTRQHFPKRSDLTGKGNQRMVPIKLEPPAESTVTPEPAQKEGLSLNKNAPERPPDVTPESVEELRQQAITLNHERKDIEQQIPALETFLKSGNAPADVRASVEQNISKHKARLAQVQDEIGLLTFRLRNAEQAKAQPPPKPELSGPANKISAETTTAREQLAAPSESTTTGFEATRLPKPVKRQGESQAEFKRRQTLAEAESGEGKKVRAAPTHAVGRPKGDPAKNSVSVQARARGGIKPTENFRGEVDRLKLIQGHRGLVNETSGLDAEQMVVALAQDGYRLPGVEFDTGGQAGFKVVDVSAALEAIEMDARGITPLHSTAKDFDSDYDFSAAELEYYAEQEARVRAEEARSTFLESGRGAELFDRIVDRKATDAERQEYIKLAEKAGISRAESEDLIADSRAEIESLQGDGREGTKPPPRAEQLGFVQEGLTQESAPPPKASDPNSPEFQQWFKGSKVVSKGQPRVVYHGTDREFSVFERGQEGAVEGIYFTTDRGGAEYWGREKGAEQPRIIEAYVSIKKPARERDIWDVVDEKGAENWKTVDAHQKMREALEAKGFDGVIMDSPQESGPRKRVLEIIAFHPDQIRIKAAPLPDQRARLAREEQTRQAELNPKGAEALARLEEIRRRGMTVDDYARQPDLTGKVPSAEEVATLRELESQSPGNRKNVQSDSSLNFGPGTMRAGEPLPEVKERKFGKRFTEDERIADEIRSEIGTAKYYEPIPNKITAAEATKLVEQRGIGESIRIIRDEKNDLPAHIRATMGQIVIQRLNQTYKNLRQAGSDKAEGVLDQAVDLAEWAMDYGTRLGQGVQSFAMWSRLTPEGILLTYKRSVDKARARHQKLYGEDVAEIIETISRKDMTDAQREEALRNLFKTNKTARKVKPDFDKILEAAKTGKLTDTLFYEIVGDRLGLPGYNREVAEKITDLAHQIEEAPEGLPRNKIVLELQKFIAEQKGFDVADLPLGIFYGNILSGYNTHAVNFSDTGLNVLSEINGLALNNPRAAAKVYGGMLRGFAEGRFDALLELSRGRMVTDGKWLEVPRLMEVAQFGQKGGVPIKTETKTGQVAKKIAESKIAIPLNAYKYVTRAMAASDAIMFRAAKEARATLLAYRMAKAEGLDGAKLEQRVREILALDREADFLAQAQREGFTGNEAQFRAKELREMVRDKDLTADAAEFAGEATYNHVPHGTLGLIAERVGKLSEDIKPLKLFVPFTRIVANVTNRGLNYTPYGYKRAFAGWGFGANAEPLTAEGRRLMFTRATMGTAGLVLLGAMQEAGLLQIHGNGPTDREKRRQMQNAGWRPYSLQIGNTYISYVYSPVGLGLSIIGNMKDSDRYHELQQKDAATKGAYSVARLGSTIFSQSFLSGLSRLFNALSDRPEVSVTAVKQTLGGTASAFAVPNIFRDIHRLFDNTAYQSNTLMEDLVRNTPFAALSGLNPQLNAFGEPVKLQRQRFLDIQTSDPAWSFVIQKGLRVPVPGRTTEIEKGKRITPEQYYQLLKTTGPQIKQWILDNRSFLEPMTETEAQDELQDAATAIRKRALAEMRGKMVKPMKPPSPPKPEAPEKP